MFLLVVEVLAMKIRNNNKIIGIQVPTHEKELKTEIKISQLADDTTIFVDSVQSGNEAMKEVQLLVYMPALNLISQRHRL